ncbi:MAG: WXG100 family type VII secretion target [Ktedonobacteraceae bacterium]
MAPQENNNTTGVIHINTDLMRQLGQVFVELNTQIQTQIEPNIQNRISQLESDWQGVSREYFDELIQQWLSTTNQVVQVGEDLGRHLQNTAQQFENADQSS